MSLTEHVTANEAAIRLAMFLGIFVLMAAWEWLAPRRVLSVSKAKRWLNNIGLMVLNTLVLRVLFPAAALGFALYAQHLGWGLFNQVDLPLALEVIIAVMLLDMAIYWQHRVFHTVPWLWRLHRVHHADRDIDITTAVRFHTVEMVLSMGIKFVVILLLGAPLLAVVIFEVVLNVMAIFNHANARLPLALDRWLRLFVVTPDMHRVHHSIVKRETNSNYGFNLPWWDRLFGSYRAQPAAGHDGMIIGNEHYRAPAQVIGLPGLLAMPFSKASGRWKGA